MASPGPNGATYYQRDAAPRKGVPKPTQPKKPGGGGRKPARKEAEMQQIHSHHHPPPVQIIPSWLYPVLINVMVMLISGGVSYGLLKGDIDSLKANDANINQVLATQAIRIDSFVKEQERVTRLEERLGNIASLLQEIRADLREGRYSPTKKQ